MFVEGVESQRTIRAALRTGTTLPAHAVGAGKATLATLSDDQLRELYRHRPPEALTDRTLSNVDELLEEIARVRERGYAINRGESEAGVLAMGIAVSMTDPDALCGISLAGPVADSSVDGDWEQRLANQLRDAAAALAKAIKAADC